MSVTSRRAEQYAAWRVMRSDRRFLWAYAAAAAGCSLAGNLGHVWTLRHAAEPPLWMAFAWALVAPILLMLAAYAKPTLKRMLALGRTQGVGGDTDSDRPSSVVVWGVFVGAFLWSAYGIYGFTVAVGVPAAVAWLAPATIDVALFGALRGLVLTTPIAARMREGLEPTRPALVAAAQPRKPAPTQFRTSSAPLPAPSPGSESAPTAPKPAAKPAPKPAAESAPDIEELVAQVVASRAVKQPENVVRDILVAKAGGAAKQRIADDLDVHHSVVQRVLTAAEPVLARR
jgi:hypothetical protein